MKTCLIYLESEYEKYAVDLLKVVEEMYGPEFVSVGLSVRGNPQLAMGKFDEILTVNDIEIQQWDPAQITDIIDELMEQYNFHSILIPATYQGRMLAPRTARRLNTGLVADVTEIQQRNGKLILVRPAFSGKIMAGIVNEKSLPIMMSVRPNVFSYDKNPEKNTLIREYKPKKVRKNSISMIRRLEKPDSRDIRDARVLVSAGGGAMNAMDTAEELADLLGGMKAASRKTVDSGKADRSIQVGQSGKVVSPDLYIGAGIYGAIQHIAGLSKVKHLIAINTDVNAPLCSLADIVVEGDAQDFMDKLITRIKEDL